MKFNLWSQHGALNSAPVFTAFERGAHAIGHDTEHNSTDGDVDVIWSVLWKGRMAPNKKIFDKAKAEGRKVIVLEVGAIKRNYSWKMGIGGVNARAIYGDVLNNRGRADFLQLKADKWRKNEDGHILIASQHNESGQWENKEHQRQWVADVCKTIRLHTDRPIVIRQHPRCADRYDNLVSNTTIEHPKKIRGTYDDYDLDVSKAYAVVSYSSNAGIHAALKGVPVCCSHTSLAWSVGNLDFNNINKPLMPARRQWMNDLAYTEWTTDELLSGKPLLRLTPFLE